MAVSPASRAATLGAELTTEQVASILTEPLRKASTFLASGVRVFDTTGPIRFPIAPTFADDADAPVAGSGVADFWTGEGGLITEAEPSFAELSLLPSTMKSVKVITRYSNELARASTAGIDGVLSSALVNEVAQRIDYKFYGADGDGTNTPKGMFAWSGTQSVDLNDGTDQPLTLDAILDGQALALGANVPVENLRLYLRPTDFMALRALKGDDQRYLLEPDATKGSVPTILGMPVTVSPMIPAGRAALADPTQIVVARDASPSVKVLTERYADYDEQAVRVVCRYDVGVLNADAVVTFKNIATGD